MQIKLTPIKVKDVFDQFVDSGEDGVFGYHGQLSIRPKYQREFVYDEPHQQAVIDTVINNLPLNTMYWSVSRDDQTGKPVLAPNGKQAYELLDGQQRILSICKFLKGERL